MDGTTPVLGNGALYVPSILQNGNRAQEADNILTNDDTYLMYLYRLMDISLSVFDWQNMPNGLDLRMLEYWLMVNGVVAIFKDPDLVTDPRAGGKAPEGYAVLPVNLKGTFDMYCYPKERDAYSVNGMSIELNEENSVLVFNDMLRAPMLMTLQLYARRLAEIERAIDVNVRNQKAPRIIRTDTNELMTAKNFMKQVDGNVYNIFVDKKFDMNNVEVLDLSAPYVSNELNTLKHQIWNEALTFCGIENVNTEKKERLVTDEIFSNMGDVEAQRFTRLNCRQIACNEAKDLWGVDWECKFKSGQYIKSVENSTINIPTEGMESTTVKAGGEQYGDD